MATVEPAAKADFWDSFSATTEDIREGLAAGRAIAADGHWTTWALFCARVALDPLLTTYKDPIPILNAFVWDYHTGAIAPSGR